MPIFPGDALGIGVGMDGQNLGMMLRQRLVQLLDLAVAERLGERQAVDLSANARRNRRDVDGFVAHGVTSRVRGIYEFSGTAATAAAITALSRRTVTKRVELLKDIKPDLARLAILRNPPIPPPVFTRARQKGQAGSS
ncbi:MAG TPA: hypothetical protein VNC81_00255, partial [Xanthobacteraceae bacterium]|nr:hypothetical protein [Xanthobacteraceae bacterium]